MRRLAILRRIARRRRPRRFVVDPNVLIAGLGGSGPSGPPALLLGAIRDKEIEVVACPNLIGEVQRGLRKPYFSARLGEEEARREVAAIERVVVMVDDPVEVEAILRDPDDDYLLALARQAGAEAIVSGDGHLLDHPGLAPKAISPREACELVGVID